MFTGLIQHIGHIDSCAQHTKAMRLWLDLDHAKASEESTPTLGESIAVNGVCLSLADKLTEKKKSRLGFDVSSETMRVSTFGQITSADSKGRAVNLERALILGERLGGHMLSGHVDGVGELLTINEVSGAHAMVFSLPHSLARYVAVKGAIALDGVSLTVSAVSAASFTVHVIPFTLENTIIGQYAVGVSVNLEIDIISRYLERLLSLR